MANAQTNAPTAKAAKAAKTAKAPQKTAEQQQAPVPAPAQNTESPVIAGTAAPRVNLRSLISGAKAALVGNTSVYNMRGKGRLVLNIKDLQNPAQASLLSVVYDEGHENIKHGLFNMKFESVRRQLFGQLRAMVEANPEGIPIHMSDAGRVTAILPNEQVTIGLVLDARRRAYNPAPTALDTATGNQRQPQMLRIQYVRTLPDGRVEITPDGRSFTAVYVDATPELQNRFLRTLAAHMPKDFVLPAIGEKIDGEEVTPDNQGEFIEPLTEAGALMLTTLSSAQASVALTHTSEHAGGGGDEQDDEGDDAGTI